MKIKPSFSFPYGFKVTTKILSPAKFLKAGGGTTDLAFWCGATRTIYLRDDRAPVELWADYMHELEHAWVDYRWWLMNQAFSQ